MSVTYQGTARCTYGGKCVPFVIVRDGAGREIPTTMAPRDCGFFAPITLRKGTVLEERYPWNQQPLNAEGTATTGTEVPRGSYTVMADWHDIGRSAPVALQLVN
jgi:hypothetical protein